MLFVEVIPMSDPVRLVITLLIIVASGAKAIHLLYLIITDWRRGVPC